MSGYGNSIYQGFAMGAMLDGKKSDAKQLKMQEQQMQMAKDNADITNAMRIIKEPFTPDSMRIKLVNDVVFPKVSRSELGEKIDFQKITEWNDGYMDLAKKVYAVETNKDLNRGQKKIITFGILRDFFQSEEAATNLLSGEESRKMAGKVLQYKQLLSKLYGQKETPEELENLVTIKKEIQDNVNKDPDLIAELNAIGEEYPEAVFAATQQGRSGGGVPSEIQIDKYLKTLPEDERQQFLERTKQRPVGNAYDEEHWKEFSRQSAKTYSQQLEDLQKDANKGYEDLALAGEMSQLLSQTETGALEPYKTKMYAYAESIGIPIGETRGKKLGVNQTIDAINGKLTIMARNMGSGNVLAGSLSDQDRKFLQKIAPGLDKSMASNKLLIGIATRAARRRIQIAELASEYAEENGTMKGFDNYKKGWLKANPLFKELDTSTSTQTTPLDTPEEQQLMEFMK